jgi:O-antigen/teichoic acid export membrane protein
VPGIQLIPKWPGGKRFKEFFDYSIYVFATQIADLLRFKVDSFVIAAYLGAAPVTVYFIAAQLVNYIITLMTNIYGMLTPVFSRYDGQKDLVNLREKFFLTTKISIFMSVLLCGSALIFGRPFIARWMGPTYDEVYPILVVLTVATGIALMQSPSISLLYATSRHRFYAYANSIEGVANLVLSLILVRHFGLLGVALGTAIPMVVIKVLVQPVYVCRVSDISLSHYLATFLKAVLASGVAMLLPWLAIRPFIAATYPNMFGLSAVLAVAYMLIALFLVFSRDERRLFAPVFARLAVAR